MAKETYFEMIQVYTPVDELDGTRGWSRRVEGFERREPQREALKNSG
jgi:hypothetical protein